jgi:copper chaperone
VAELTLNVEGMDCSGCEESIKRSVGKLPGIQQVNADHVSGRVEVTGEPDESKVREAIVDAGFEVR